MERKEETYRQQILSNKDAVLQVLPDAEDVLEYIGSSGQLSVFNNDFALKYQSLPVEAHYDKRLRLLYIELSGKRLYYPSKYSSRDVSFVFRAISLEQDEDSPHRYLDDNEDLKDAILFDCGCAEGNLPFDHVDELRHAYLFEGDPTWVGPLKATFAPWKEKVTVVEKFLGSGEDQVSLREYLEKLVEDGRLDYERDKVFVKMDLEGAEPDLMRDIAPILHRFKDIRLAVCVYHKKDDEQEVIDAVPSGFTHRARPGYMYFHMHEDEPVFPYFRHGVMRIERDSSAH
jgi:hypothetical protein